MIAGAAGSMGSEKSRRRRREDGNVWFLRTGQNSFMIFFKSIMIDKRIEPVLGVH